MKEMPKANLVIIRRIIGITTLVFWVIFIVPWIILPAGDRLAWQLQKWILLVAAILTLIYIVMLIIHITQRKHWMDRTARWISCASTVLLGALLLLCASFRYGNKVWGNNKYVVYNEFGELLEPDQYVLYKRNGFIENRMYTIRYDDERDHTTKYEYAIYEPLDLIKVESSVRMFHDNKVYHETDFYRLCDGYHYCQSQNDFLFALINQYNLR